MRLSEIVRKKRREKGLSQAELARKVDVSQASMSYYERGQTTPKEEILRKLEETLELEQGELIQRAQTDQLAEPVSASMADSLENQRRSLVDSFNTIPEAHTVLDLPVAKTGGDLTFAVDLRSHLLFSIVDGTGSGRQGALSSLLAASAMVGQLSLQQSGVVWPHEMIQASDFAGQILGSEDRLAEVFIGLFDRRHKVLSFCRTTFPVPFLRSRNKISRLRGSDGEFGFCWSGKVKIAPDSLLLVATDGVAHLATKSRRTYWNTPELKTAIGNARTPEDLVQQLRRRVATKFGGDGKRDDMLALVLSL